MTCDQSDSSSSSGILVRLLRAGGVDRAVGYAILGNATSLVLGPATALLIAYRFSPELQGYYYTFGSLTSLQSFLDMGLGQAIIQFASHEWANLEFDANGRISGNPDSLSRLNSLVRLASRWYGYAAALLVVGLGPVGYMFFKQTSAPGIDWILPWFALCLGVGASFYISPLFWLLQGCNQVTQFWYYRFIQKLVYGLFILATILLGAGLWSLSIASVAILLWSVYFIARYYRGFIKSILTISQGPQVLWGKEVWPIQWRIAISWLSAYFTTSLFAPILFKFSGPVVAGQMGMTVTLAILLLAISSNWVVTKAPYFGILVAQKRFKELEGLFWRSFIRTLVVIVLGTMAIVVGVYFLSHFRHPLGARLLPPLPAALLLSGSALSAISICMSVYLRAHKKEPLATAYLVSGGMTLVLALGLGSRFGAIGVTAGYLCAMAILQIPLTLVIFFRCREAWQKERLNCSSQTGVAG